MITRRSFLSGLAAVLWLVLGLAAAPVHAAEWLIAFQAVPDSGDAVYNKQAAQTAGLIAEIGPPVLGALGLDPASFDADIVIGGYRGRINPTVVVHLDGDAAMADRVAAAFGFVCDQTSVLVWREDGGPVLAVNVGFPTLTPTLAEFFFRNAMAVNLGLAGGFTARDNRLEFINLRGADGQPLSGLDDDKFSAALRQAAKAFGDIATVTTTTVDARLVANDGYRAIIGDAGLPALDKLRHRRAELVAAPH